MHQEGQQVTGLGVYVLRTDQNNFINVGLQEPRLHTDHWMVLEVLRQEGATRNYRYRLKRTS